MMMCRHKQASFKVRNKMMQNTSVLLKVRRFNADCVMNALCDLCESCGCFF